MAAIPPAGIQLTPGWPCERKGRPRDFRMGVTKLGASVVGTWRGEWYSWRPQETGIRLSPFVHVTEDKQCVASAGVWFELYAMPFCQSQTCPALSEWSGWQTGLQWWTSSIRLLPVPVPTKAKVMSHSSCLWPRHLPQPQNAHRCF